MRRLSAAVAVVLGVALAAPARAEVTRTLRVEIPRESGSFKIENLAGTMTVVASGAGPVVAIATVHAENDDLAGRMRFERVASLADAGVALFRVRYPLEQIGTVRYPGRRQSSGFLERLLDGSRTQVRYDDRRVTVSGSSGTLLYADVEVQVPAGTEIEATFRNLVGLLKGTAVKGTMRFDTSSGDVAIERLSGKIDADTGSGDVRASSLEGTFRCDTGSGDCTLEGFRGERLTLDTGSGDVRASRVAARTLSADTGSGDIRVQDADLEEFDADTGSGNVELAARGAARLARIHADTGSGDVILRLGPDASFEATASQGSGDIINRYADAQPIVKRKEVIGYRRGDGRIRIEIDTGSGDLTLDPAGPKGGGT
jgi:hypothetical protein